MKMKKRTMKSNTEKRILILAFIVTCIQMSVLANAEQQSNFLIDMAYGKFLIDSLNFLQEKVAKNQFTESDARTLGKLIEFFIRLKENVNQRRMKEGSVYWYTRKGRDYNDGRKKAFNN
jgi:hypothetical protein